MHNARMSDAQDATQRTQTLGNARFAQSYAKINLTLDVLGKRSDGYHELATVMQTIDLYDTICLSMTREPGIQIICSRPELNTRDNLVVRAAEALYQRFSLSQGLLIELYKRIPVAAGLGGGSSNAAAVLLTLWRWWDLSLSPSDLQAIAASLGSDVPFFLSGGLALCEGRGEQVAPLSPGWPASMRWLLLVKPSIGVSTATVFRHLDARDFTDGASSRAACAAFQAQMTFQPGEHLHNSLERGVLERYPEVALAREAMLLAGAAYVQLSGSGPTLFAPFSDLARASGAQQYLLAQGYEAFLVRAVFPDVDNVSFF